MRRIVKITLITLLVAYFAIAKYCDFKQALNIPNNCPCRATQQEFK